MLGTKRLALAASAALSASLIAACLGATVANAAARPNHSASTAGRSLHLSAAALHAGSSSTPGLKAAHVRPATGSTIGAGEYTGAAVITAGTTFKMPAFSCKSSSDAEWLLPGLWVFDSSGDLLSQVDVNFNCNEGTKLQESVICMNGGSCDNSLTPNPGDVMEAVYTVNGSSSIGTLYDKTQGMVAQVAGTSGGETSILFGDLSGANFGVTAVPTFGKVSFSNASLNGFVLGDWGPAVLTLKNGSDNQIKGSAASATSFTTKFVNNY